jgi:hypothetical protein
VLARLSRARNSLLWINVKIVSANGRSIVAVQPAQYNCHGTDATPNHVQL